MLPVSSVFNVNPKTSLAHQINKTTRECAQKDGITVAAIALESCKNDRVNDIHKILFQISSYPKGNKAMDVRCDLPAKQRPTCAPLQLTH
jgi:hypothetical protein